MSDKVKYILYTIFDWGLTFGGTAAVIVYNFVTEDNSTGYKLGFGGIVLVVAMIFSAKYMFEKSYRTKLDTYLQQLAEATDTEVKSAISKKNREPKNAKQHLRAIDDIVAVRCYLCCHLARFDKSCEPTIDNGTYSCKYGRR